MMWLCMTYKKDAKMFKAECDKNNLRIIDLS